MQPGGRGKCRVRISIQQVLSDGNNVWTVTDDNFDDEYPDCYQLILTWDGHDGEDYEIYLINIPEPTSAALLGAGVALIVSRRSLRRRQRSGGRK